MVLASDGVLCVAAAAGSAAQALYCSEMPLELRAIARPATGLLQ